MSSICLLAWLAAGTQQGASISLGVPHPKAGAPAWLARPPLLQHLIINETIIRAIMHQCPRRRTTAAATRGVARVQQAGHARVQQAFCSKQGTDVAGTLTFPFAMCPYSPPLLLEFPNRAAERCCLQPPRVSFPLLSPSKPQSLNRGGLPVLHLCYPAPRAHACITRSHP